MPFSTFLLVCLAQAPSKAAGQASGACVVKEPSEAAPEMFYSHDLLGRKSPLGAVW